MFEGFVRQLILGYLGRFVKDIQQDQLKITLWNEEVLLENVELTLEAFDYLQLPFTLKQGRVGKLSIKIPWKKLGWDPIVIVLENVFVSASQRTDDEWSEEAVRKREFAGKKAKLAAAELAKLSKRVNDDRAGRLFTSYISAKILDNIQVSIRSFHVAYHDMQGDSAHTMLGLKFSSLTVMKQNPFSLSSAKIKGGLVNKTLDITGLEIYCGTYQGPVNISTMDNARPDGTKNDTILAPCDVNMSLKISKSGQLDNNNQNSVSATISALEISLDEVQLQQLLILWDYLCTYPLREKYGRYRPWCNPLAKKLDGWKKLWWRYALESVMLDVNKKLKKTSWRYLGERLSYRRKYVNLYKAKLYSLQQDQSIDENVLSELEQMEKELDIEDILSYRSAAECRLQEISFSTLAVNINEVKQPTSLIRSTSVDSSLDKSRSNEHLTGKSRGWLNWLSLGMLGAGGTDDSSQFSGVVSDEVLKDLYEATDFHPMSTFDVDTVIDDEIYVYVMKFTIHHISIMLRSRKYSQDFGQLVLIGSVIECKLWENSVTTVTAISSVEMIYPCNKKVVLLIKRPHDDNNLLESETHSLKLQVDAYPNNDVDLLVKGLLEPVEVTYDADFFSNFMEFFGIFSSFESQHERVLSSLNGIKDINTRLCSKAEYILSSHKKFFWDVGIKKIVIHVPWDIEVPGQGELVLNVGSVALITKGLKGSFFLDNELRLCDQEKLTVDSTIYNKLKDLSDQHEVKVNDLEMTMIMPSHSKPISLFEKFSASIMLTYCVVLDESITKQLEVFVNVSSLQAYFSTSAYDAFLRLVSHLGAVEPQTLFTTVDSPSVKSNRQMGPDFGFGVNVKSQSVKLLVDLGNDGENSLALNFVLQELDLCYALTSFEKCSISLKKLNVNMSSSRSESVSYVLFSSGNHVRSDSVHGNTIDKLTDRLLSAEGCFFLLYDNTFETKSACCKYTIWLNDSEIHCYPFVIRSIVKFLENLSKLQASWEAKSSFSSVNGEDEKNIPGFSFQRFGLSNYFEACSPEYASIPLDHFPFITISSGGSLDNLESSCLCSGPEWRKYLNLRDRKIRTRKFRIKESKNDISHAKASRNSGETASTLFDLSISSLRLHFHDSSSIVGTITLPSSIGSVFVSEHSIDAVFSSEGLMLTSLWWTKNYHEFLWGPSLPNLSPIINARVRINRHGSSSSHLEVGISVQHVYCLLPPEYLAIIIGYFSLPDWSSDTFEKGEGENIGKADTENEDSILYKFEILDSVLILPAETIDPQFLRVDIPHLCCSFIHNCSSNNALEGIPPEYLVPIPKLARRNNCLNIFGRDVVLSYLPFKEEAYVNLRLEKDTMALLASFSADIWVRFPCGSESSPKESSHSTTCIMARLAECQVIAEGDHISSGIETLLDVVNQFFLVSNLSECFKSDVLQFLQLKRGNITATPVDSSIVLTEARCHINSLSLNLFHSRKGLSEPFAKVKVQLMFSAILENDVVLRSLDLGLTSVELLSLPNSIALARWTSPSSTLHHFDGSTLEGKKCRTELYISLPCLDVWVHLSEWLELTETLASYADQLTKTSPLNSLENMKQETGILSAKLENISITFYIPIYGSSKSCGEFLVAADQRESSSFSSAGVMDGSYLKYVSVTMQSKGSEILVDGKTTKLKSKMERWSGTVSVSEDDKNVVSWPLFQIFHVFIEAEISHDTMEQVHVKAGFRLDHLKVWLSHHFIYFCHGVTFAVPESKSAQFPFGSIDIEVKMRKISFLISDGRWSCTGPLFEMLLRNIMLDFKMMENSSESLITGQVHVSYNNIHKTFWEPFIEPWQFEIGMTRNQDTNLSSPIVTNIHLKSTVQLNLNFTEPLIECVLRTVDMVKDSLGIIKASDAPESQKLLNSPWKQMYAGRYAPYVLQNLTSVPLFYHVYRGSLDSLDLIELKSETSVEPSGSVPLHLNDVPEEQLFDVWPAHSSDRLNEQKLTSVAHHFVTIQLEGTSVSSSPISVDRVGLTCLEFDFSKSYDNDGGESSSLETRSGFVVPVVFDVSVQRYSKLIRLYSTVILSNATSLPIELRFDIPFSVTPMILDPVYPGQELPLPLHLAEAGRIRWRPIGNSYLWSEVHSLANLLVQETKVGFLKSFVCYPAQPTNDPFRCCISVRNTSLPVIRCTSNSYVKSGEKLKKPDGSNRHHVHHLTLHTPLLVKNYLPQEVSLAIESGGVTHRALLSEVETFFHNVDPLHDLGIEIHMQGFKPAPLKFPRTETFCTMAKFSGTKFTLSEIITFDPCFSNGPVCITVEKMTDALSGDRELSIYVPFLLYNCTGLPLMISEFGSDVSGVSCFVPSSYDVSEQEPYQAIDGLSLVSSIHDLQASDRNWIKSPTLSHVLSVRNNLTPLKQEFYSNFLISETQNDSSISKKRLSSSFSELNSRNSNFIGNEEGKVGPRMYSPVSSSSDNELIITVKAQSENLNTTTTYWSNPFPLIPQSGSTSILVPRSPNSSYMISVTSSAVAGPLTGRSSAIIFQPRYVICNACSKDLCYKQKGTNQVFHLGVREHSHLHWLDSSRELLVSIRYNDAGWQWSGSFLPDHLGDTQVKMQNHVSGSSSIIRVEVQNADISVQDDKVVGSLRGNSGTILILLSDDDTGYMPYRIDNFSKERLRIFQQKCEMFETLIHPYSSYSYAWDEPCYPHRLTMEVTGECVLGSYSLDDVKEYMPIHLPSSSEKPERKLVLSVHAEGATKVLRVIDFNLHVLEDMEMPSVPLLRGKKKNEPKQEKIFHYNEKISFVIPHLGVSLINMHPQELLFASAKNITIDVMQNFDQQKLSFQVSSLQVDNQLRSSPYPVMLYFDREYRSNSAEKKSHGSADGSCQPVVHIAVSKWRKQDSSLVSFEYLSLRIADFCLELEQEVILSLLDFIRNITSHVHGGVVKLADPLSLMSTTSLAESSSSQSSQSSDYHQKARGKKNNLINGVNDFHKLTQSLPSVVPIGAPWQQIYLLARRHKKIYIEAFEMSPINLTLSFSSAPWILRNGVLTSEESLVHRGLMALADIERAQVHLNQLTFAHYISGWESIQEIFLRHLSRQLLHEMYKVFGSAGVIGNPMGFARTLGLGLREFLSVPARTIFESPTGLITGMAQGTTSLLSNTVYAISDAATQFSKVAHKGIVAFTFDDQAVLRMGHQHNGGASHSKGVINEVFEGLTGLLQLPIKGAEKHGIPGVFSGIALGLTGLVAKPAASILQVTGATAQSIRNRSKLYQMRRLIFRVRLPRPLRGEALVRPYSWEEAIGDSVLCQVGDGLRFKDEVLVTCKALKQAGNFVIITERLMLIVSCSGLAELGNPEFRGVPADLDWVIEAEIYLESVMHSDQEQEMVHIVGSCSDTLSRQNQHAKRGNLSTVRWNSPSIPLVQTSLELTHCEDAEDLLRILLSTIERGKDQGWGSRYILHRSSINRWVDD